MTEHELQNLIRVALSEYGIVFRTNAGKFWQGKRVWSKEHQSMVLTDLKVIEGLPSGFPDLLFVDQRGCAFIEVKTKTGRVRKDQEKFISKMRSLGLRAGVARSVEDAVNIVQEVM